MLFIQNFATSHLCMSGVIFMLSRLRPPHSLQTFPPSAPSTLLGCDPPQSALSDCPLLIVTPYFLLRNLSSYLKMIVSHVT